MFMEEEISKVYCSLAKLRNEGCGLHAATQIKRNAKHCGRVGSIIHQHPYLTCFLLTVLLILQRFNCT